MVQIWQMEPYPCGDPRLPHHFFPPKMITPDDLLKRSGAHIWQVNSSDPMALARRITTLKLEKGYIREDLFILDESTTANFKDKIEELFEESEEKSEFARLVIEGEAYYDVEDNDGNWCRILVEHGDLILIPAHRQYRFTTTPKNFVKMKRFFKE
ncbi:hypothetical protein PFISCL1PPCAC_7890 [Pristionchus fissidentatus]|uniref:1,2-dihydroxy-3-keto-5-methylthiopentene dioxygenase homolog n=1 Tax=Pristionchus fissidentatus TaxID=1538716 RepID=A0AAV5VBG2_9BILA|nr:hypothetical protein PFISCL1PPCAC_7890 [Pristionchus fissidentatus]